MSALEEEKGVHLVNESIGDSSSPDIPAVIPQDDAHVTVKVWTVVMIVSWPLRIVQV